MEGGWFDPEALEAERRDADLEYAALVAAGKAAAAGHVKMLRDRSAGDLWAAATACHHGWGFPLASLAGKDDPAWGEDGWRCLHCGSRLSAEPWADDCKVLIPCEVETK